MKKLFKCGGCGYIHEGETAITCPKCGAPAEMFTELDEVAATLIKRSDYTNDLHMELITLAMKMDALCTKGIEDALDPNCVIVFTKAKHHAWEIKQMAKAELAGHQSKGKFN